MMYGSVSVFSITVHPGGRNDKWLLLSDHDHGSD